MEKFEAKLEIIGINPFVFVPEQILAGIFEEAGRNKGPLPVYGSVNGAPYVQTLVKYSGHWRLYINTTMLPGSPRKIGEIIEVTIQFDPVDRTIPPHAELVRALNENREAKKAFDDLSPSLQKEIIRYIFFLKSEESIKNNVNRAIGFLLGKNRFVGRDKP